MLERLSPDDYVMWQRLHQEQGFWWEQLRFMLAQVCSVIINAAPTVDKDGKIYYRSHENARATALDFIPKHWLGGLTPRRGAPVDITGGVRTDGGTPALSEHGKAVRRGMTAADANAFLAEMAGRG